MTPIQTQSQSPSPPSGGQTFAGYDTQGFYDELFDTQNRPRPDVALLARRIESLGIQELVRRQSAVERALLSMGITFSVYGDERGTEKIWPFDIIPRIISAAEWAWIERGLKQRLRALNAFIDDVYHQQNIF